MRTLYRASMVHTLSYPPRGEWVLIDGRHVQRVGSGEPPQADRVVELPGTTIIPGFVDAHVHLTGTGVHHQAPEVAGARSVHELLEILRKVVKDKDGPVLVHGYDESKWDRTELPTIAELDGVTEQPLAVVRVDGHLTLANLRGLQDSGALDVDGAERDADGRPTGKVTSEANVRLRHWFQQHLADHDVEELQLDAASLAVAHGVTCIHEMSMPKERGMRDLEILLGHRARLPLDVVPYVATTDVGRVLDLGLRRIGGDLPVDGSIGARTAWLFEPFADHEGSGAGYFGDDELAEFFHGAHLAGLQVGVHAIGDAAIEQVVRTWERVYQSLDSGSGATSGPAATASSTSRWPTGAWWSGPRRWGSPSRCSPRSTPSGATPAACTSRGWAEEGRADEPVPRPSLTEGSRWGRARTRRSRSIDPLAGVAAFEAHHDPAQRLRREEAVRVYTLGSARLAHQEDKKGSLEPGKHADFAVYEEDPSWPTRSRAFARSSPCRLGRDVYAA